MCLPYAISVAAASLIYVAVADLIPGLHRRVDPGAALGSGAADRLRRRGHRGGAQLVARLAGLNLIGRGPRRHAVRLDAITASALNLGRGPVIRYN